MKYSEYLREARKKGWQYIRPRKGSHEIWEKDGKKVSIPNHGAKEIPKGLESNLRKEMEM
ncbi:MAG TPA: type II toxin-antitoxin system HicA family toxin [Bacteroidales bacterium]|jgi:mRNA interferase HicA|nr:type II toxin-antitoxin system HicA family toxin [Bacteroidales bacterium]